MLAFDVRDSFEFDISSVDISNCISVWYFVDPLIFTIYEFLIVKFEATGWTKRGTDQWLTVALISLPTHFSFMFVIRVLSHYKNS